MPPMTLSNFYHARGYRGGTDADHVPVIPGNDFPPDTNHQDETPLRHLALGDADMGQAPFAQ